ncbi:CLOCK-interacting pacemaker a [Erpetoichthys calabaricus]|uniref:CLOCK-interacting pacemaker a n=1 Tax=Erpetoichthys calabaricus TaxID=27687 RepID=A0A8C4SX27_ERPCA|nr:CLOCK-interacting pacemaker a [Erpetoichthys calabaricus]XP_028677515.1 CLOCK-interacting pacemaker a [Erpetoichthys calabaricus]
MNNKSRCESYKRANERQHPEMTEKKRHLHAHCSKRDLDRDSGFSDASSEYLSTVEHTDSEDVQKHLPQNVGSWSQQANVSVFGGTFPGLSPVIVMNNVLLKNPDNAIPQIKPWAFHPSLEMIPQPQVVFLQPVVSNPGNQQKILKQRKQRLGNYRPLLKSYPKIAPHPGDKTSKKATSFSSSQELPAKSKTAAYNWEKEDNAITIESSASVDKCSVVNMHDVGIEQPSHDWHQAKDDVLTTDESNDVIDKPSETSYFHEKMSPQSSSLPEFISNCPSINPLPVRDPKNIRNEEDSTDSLSRIKENKRKRFCNTYNILSKSGLLGITLRTKELIRQSRKTQNELELLKEHTSLFLEVVKSGDPEVLTKLQTAMLKTTHLVSASPNGCNEQREEAPSSQYFAMNT